MLKELLKENSIGNKEEILFILFNALSQGENQSITTLQNYCNSKFFSISRSFSGIIKLLQFVSFIKIAEKKIQLTTINFNQSTFSRNTYFDQPHFFLNLFNSLEKEGALTEVFNLKNIKFNIENSQYYILENKFPFHFFPIRNLFLSTGFLQRDKNIFSHLLIKKEFSNFFKKTVVNKLTYNVTNQKRINLDQLKKSQELKEAAGKAAEFFVLGYEQERLKKHPHKESIKIISEEFVNAGYDIESFESVDSIVVDKFIEVKSYEDEASFFWSKNEIEKAKDLKERYYLILIKRSRIFEPNYKPIEIQDPHKKIFENSLWKKDPESWKILFE